MSISGIEKMPFDRYQALEALNQSRLKKILVCPRLFELDDEKTSYSLDLGSIVHEFLEHKSLDIFAVAPKVDKRTKIGKEKLAEFIAQNEGKILIDQNQLTLLKNVSANILNHEKANKVLLSSKAEISAFAKLNGIMCKGRFDLYNKELNLITDVKTTRRITKREFERDCISYGYPFQLAFYEKIYVELFGIKPHLAILVLETVAPFEACLYEPNRDWIEYGRNQVTKAFEIYIDCMDKGYFPTKQDGKAQNLYLPNWKGLKE